MLSTKELDTNLLEAAFYEKPFKFSYSSLNKLMTSPSIFYKEYVLKEREDETKKYLLEGILIHFLVLENINFDEKFLVMPDSLPSDKVVDVVKFIYSLYKAEENPDPDKELGDYRNQILDQLKEINFYQNLKDTKDGLGDDKRIAKIVDIKTEAYFEFLKKQQGRTIIDSELLDRCTRRAEVVTNNPEMRKLLGLDLSNDGKTFGVYNELELDMNTEGKLPFGFKGIIDNIVVDVKHKLIKINDFKTTGKDLTKFSDSVEFWNYWLQAAMYKKLVSNFFSKVLTNDWTIEFRFIVFDKYDQLYAYPVSEETMLAWEARLEETIFQANFHYTSKEFTLPYNYAIGNVKL